MKITLFFVVVISTLMVFQLAEAQDGDEPAMSAAVEKKAKPEETSSQGASKGGRGEKNGRGGRGPPNGGPRRGRGLPKERTNSQNGPAASRSMPIDESAKARNWMRELQGTGGSNRTSDLPNFGAASSRQ